MPKRPRRKRFRPPKRVQIKKNSVEIPTNSQASNSPESSPRNLEKGENILPESTTRETVSDKYPCDVSGEAISSDEKVLPDKDHNYCLPLKECPISEILPVCESTRLVSLTNLSAVQFEESTAAPDGTEPCFIGEKPTKSVFCAPSNLKETSTGSNITCAITANKLSPGFRLPFPSPSSYVPDGVSVHSTPASIHTSGSNILASPGSSLTPPSLSFYAPDEPILVSSHASTNSSCPRNSCLEDLLCEAKFKVDLHLHKHWTSYMNNGRLHVMLLSRKEEIAIQRRLFFSPDGETGLSVHCVQLPLEDLLSDSKIPERVSLTSDTVDKFVDRIVKIVEAVRNYEICAGQSDDKNKHVWSSIQSAKIDDNPYQECRYVETLRCLNCLRLVPVRQWRCSECGKLKFSIRRRVAAFEKEPLPNTPNVLLSDEQKLKKLEDQHKKLAVQSRRIERLEERVEKLLDVEGLNLPEETTEDLMTVLMESDLTPLQTLFLQQQVKAAKAKGPSGVRWHPTMIRFALALFMASPAGYQTARDSGMIKLPSQRTLFDYSHAFKATEGVDDDALETVAEIIEKLPHDHQKYHCLLCDEMHICQNLVFRKATGEMIGYVNLSNAFADVAALEIFLQKGDSVPKPELATKMLTYMVKGVASNVKEVVATYGVSRLSAEFMYDTTWMVINRCEAAGIEIVAFVSDGYTVNRSFMKKHMAVGKTKSGLIYSTVNKSSPERLIYFMSDVAHLLKTVRNCLNNSRISKNAKRCMEKGREKLLWQTIIDLYNVYKADNLRKSYKLNSQNVFINSYSGMKVKYAAQVLSRTVAQDIEDQKWPGTNELVKFLRLFNDWFDCLNGAHTTQGQKNRNPNLNPYTSVDDPRFDFLLSVLEYLSDWKEEVFAVEAFAHNVTDSLLMGPENVFPENVLPEDDDEAEDDPVVAEAVEGRKKGSKAAKKLLSSQTLDGIEFTTLAFIDLVRFLLNEGVLFINPRAFSQDHIEQHFSKQRHRNANPNFNTFLQNNVNIRIQGHLGLKKRKSNTEDLSGEMVITEERLPKRRGTDAQCPD